MVNKSALNLGIARENQGIKSDKQGLNDEYKLLIESLFDNPNITPRLHQIHAKIESHAPGKQEVLFDLLDVLLTESTDGKKIHEAYHRAIINKIYALDRMRNNNFPQYFIDALEQLQLLYPEIDWYQRSIKNIEYSNESFHPSIPGGYFYRKNNDVSIAENDIFDELKSYIENEQYAENQSIPFPVDQELGSDQRIVPAELLDGKYNEIIRGIYEILDNEDNTIQENEQYNNALKIFLTLMNMKRGHYLTKVGNDKVGVYNFELGIRIKDKETDNWFNRYFNNYQTQGFVRPVK